MSEGRWKKSMILIASPDGPLEMDGWVYSGLGIFKMWGASPKGRRPPSWSLTHLGSGLRVCPIAAHMAEAFGIATKVADAVCWDWDGVDGYLNREPNLQKIVLATLAACNKNISLHFGDPAGNEACRTAAREVALARA